jgi:hypothetical protein
MTAIPFDTLKMVERLESAGVPTPQAKVQAAVLAEVISAEDASIAERFSGKTDVAQELAGMKAEVHALRSEFKAEVQALRSEFKQGIAETKSELIRWVVSVGILQMALVAGLVLKLVH